jgi:hypothetical protein
MKGRTQGQRVLRRIFGSSRDAVKGGWRKLHNEELHNFYSSPNITKLIKTRLLRWHVARMRVMTNGCKILDEKPEGKRPLGRLRRRREDNIKMNLREIM